MPEEQLTRVEWEKVCLIETLNARIKYIDADIQELKDRTAMNIQELEEQKKKLQEEIAKLE